MGPFCDVECYTALNLLGGESPFGQMLIVK